jgi:mannose-6-phosphate isomerase-like protein (cupin superfamily)
MSLTAFVILSFLCVVLATMTVIFYDQKRRLRDKLVSAREEIMETDHAQVRLSRRVAEYVNIDNREFVEMLIEKSTIAELESDIWKVNLPYGTWMEFPDDERVVKAFIRGFWPDMPGKLLGVRMLPGSRFNTHHHPWKEVLIGVLGEVTVEVGPQNDRRFLILGPGDVIEIAPDDPHAVLESQGLAKFVCIWGEPVTSEDPNLSPLV